MVGKGKLVLYYENEMKNYSVFAYYFVKQTKFLDLNTQILCDTNNA